MFVTSSKKLFSSIILKKVSIGWFVYFSSIPIIMSENVLFPEYKKYITSIFTYFLIFTIILYILNLTKYVF